MAAAGNATAALDAKWLAAHALGFSDVEMVTREGEEAVPEAQARLATFIARRLTGESVARIVGEREFYGLSFMLNAATLEPRPDTELLVDLAIKALPQGGRLLDLGTGTGCIPISVLVNRPDATGVAVDLSAEALEAARANARRHGVEGRLNLLEGSWFEPLAQHPHPNPPHKGEGTASSVGRNLDKDAEPKSLPLVGRGWGGGSAAPNAMVGAARRFHLIVSNPPYIAFAVIPTLPPEVRAFDPALALDGGPDGLAPYRIIVKQAPRHLLPGGRILLEIGYDQGQAVGDLLAGAGFSDIVIHKDFGGLDRVASAHHIQVTQPNDLPRANFPLGRDGRTI